MVIVHVFIHVRKDSIGPFREATLKNARNSVQEAGVIRFDVLQQENDPARFVLVEMYRTAGDPALHKETAHYREWREAVADMMEEPRYSIKFNALFPPPSDWD